MVCISKRWYCFDNIDTWGLIQQEKVKDVFIAGWTFDNLAEVEVV